MQGDAVQIIKVAIETALHNSVDYLPLPGHSIVPGLRVRVPFGRRKLIGIVVDCVKNSEIPLEKLKPIEAILDEKPLLNAPLLMLYQKASDYYHHPLGEVMMKTLPKLIRTGKPLEFSADLKYSLKNKASKIELGRAKKQIALALLLSVKPLTLSEIKKEGFGKVHLDGLINKGLVEGVVEKEAKTNRDFISMPTFLLNDAQKNAVGKIIQTENFKTFLLQGVTGSGKTEVYLQAIAHALKNNRQALILVPEIALTPQTVQRFLARFPNAIIRVLHSGLSAKDRARAWISATTGEANIIIGTRSAIFIPMPKPGLIILDEEHDSSFKQQSGFRYSARDLSVLRGHLENIPIVLGSATPALESLNNAKNRKYELLELPHRAGESTKPQVSIIDLRQQKKGELLSPPLLAKISEHLGNKGQVLLFLNRRGYAPVLMCHACGDVMKCQFCDARLVLHQNPKKLICHHCSSVKNPPRVCQQCQRADLFPMGLGTERLEEILRAHFPSHSIFRMDRDTIKNKNELDEALSKIHDRKVDILIGTQMLAKGHHFPALSLVAIVDPDSGFFSADFRGVEKLAQGILQVAGRAGREAQAGEVLIQTHHPEHPLLNILLKEGYSSFADSVLKEREAALLPPFSHLALLRAEAREREAPIQYLSHIKDAMKKNTIGHVELWGPIPASMEKKSGRYRYHLLFQSQHRGNLQKALLHLENYLKANKSKHVRWVLDVDPQETI